MIDASKKVKMGIIGVGNMGSAHAKSLFAGNINGMYICHPDGHTPVDYVILPTYEMDITKIDGATAEEENHWYGAKFETALRDLMDMLEPDAE